MKQQTLDANRKGVRGKLGNFAEKVMSSTGSALFIFSRRDFLDLPFCNITNH
jgi:hypothetical protein